MVSASLATDLVSNDESKKNTCSAARSVTCPHVRTPQNPSRPFRRYGRSQKATPSRNPETVRGGRERPGRDAPSELPLLPWELSLWRAAHLHQALQVTYVGRHPLRGPYLEHELYYPRQGCPRTLRTSHAGEGVDVPELIRKLAVSHESHQAGVRLDRDHLPDHSRSPWDRPRESRLGAQGIQAFSSHGRISPSPRPIKLHELTAGAVEATAPPEPNQDFCVHRHLSHSRRATQCVQDKAQPPAQEATCTSATTATWQTQGCARTLIHEGGRAPPGDHTPFRSPAPPPAPASHWCLKKPAPPSSPNRCCPASAAKLAARCAPAQRPGCQLPRPAPPGARKPPRPLPRAGPSGGVVRGPVEGEQSGVHRHGRGRDTTKVTRTDHTFTAGGVFQPGTGRVFH